MRKYNCTSDLLICMTSITSGSDMSFNSFVKLSCRGLLNKGNRLFLVVKISSFNILSSLNIFLSSFH